MELDINLPYHYKEYGWQIPIVKAFFDMKEIWMNIKKKKEILSL